MVVGIVTETKAKTRVPILMRVFKIYSIDKLKNNKNPFDTLMAILPYSNKQIAKMSKKKFERVVARAVKRLKKYGAEGITASLLLKKAAEDKDADTEWKNNDAKTLFLKMTPEILRKSAELSKRSLLKSSICISNTKMDRISEYLIKELCYDVKNITIFTSNTSKAQSFSDMFFDETGLSVSVYEPYPRKFDFVIDIDNAIVKVGEELFVEDVDLGYDFDDYNIGALDVATLLKTPQIAEFVCLYGYGKKRLTL